MTSKILDELAQKEDPSEEVAEIVIREPDLIPDLLEGITSENKRVKNRSIKILRTISSKKPEFLYYHWSTFLSLMRGDDTICKWNALDIIANLTPVDSQRNFDKIFDEYYDMIDDKTMITAAHIVDNSGKIALAKPEFRNKITELLLDVENDPRESTECTDILLGKTIVALDQYYDYIEDENKVIEFVKRRLKNRRPATRKKAEKFLKKWEK
ncbi:MAG: hypothetical protein HXS48_24250 [Theionarchaea archaeon]|nr:hypothetical protein [Theionarchaea archaeon]